MTLTEKIEAILFLDCPSNYECWEDLEESILAELTEEESKQFLEESPVNIEDWFIANS